MDIINPIDLYLVYCWITLKRYLDDPKNEISNQQILALLVKKTIIDKHSYDSAYPLWYKNFDNILVKEIISDFKKGIELSKVKLTYLSLLKDLLEENFILTAPERITGNDFINNLLEYKNILNNFKQQTLPDETIDLINIINEVIDNVDNQLSHTNKAELLDWDFHSIYILLNNLVQYFKNNLKTDNDFKDLNKYYEIYFKFINKNIAPVYLISEVEENISIEPLPFPDEIHLKVLDLLNLKPEVSTNKSYIITTLGDNFVTNPLYSSLFLHEIGHLLDINLINLSNIIINELLGQYPEFFNKVDQIIYQWIRELVADAAAICMGGPAYLCELSNYIQDEIIMYPTDKYPGIYFRTSILYNYLFNNEFISLFDKDSLTKLHNKLSSFQNKYQTNNTVLLEFEKLLQGSLIPIYRTVTEFFINAGVYCSYDFMVEQICMNQGNLKLTQDSLKEHSTSFNQLITLHNINWLIELKRDDSKFFT